MLACPPTLDSDNCTKWSNPNAAFQKAVSDAMKPEPVLIWTDAQSFEEKVAAEESLRQRVLARIVSTPGLPCAGRYGGDEVAIFDATHSENFDIVSGQGRKMDQYKTTCAPAAMSSCFEGAPAPTPTPTPTPTPPPPSSSCPFSPADFQGSGRWQSLKVTQGAGTRINADATAVVCSPQCAPRTCCPSQVANPSAPEDCDALMTSPAWSVEGGAFCAAGGPDGLGDNPLRNCQLGHGQIKVCSGAKCIEAPF